MCKREVSTREPVGIRGVTRIWWHRTPFCRSRKYALYSVSEEEQTISHSCLGEKKIKNLHLIVLKTEISPEIKDICNNITKRIPKGWQV